MNDLFYIGMTKEPFYEFNKHAHSFWEIVYYTDGEGITKIGDISIEFKPKTIIFLPPYSVHSEHSVNGYRNIHFSVRQFDWLPEKPLVTQDNENEDFYSILIQLYREFNLRSNNGPNLTNGLLNVLHQYLIAWSTGPRKNPLVEKLENILLSNLSDRKFRVADALHGMYISDGYCRKIFREATGKTPLQYLTNKRIENAKQLLSNQTLHPLKVVEVARLCGFDDPYYFSRMFKKHTGIPPEKWRLTEISFIDTL